MLRLPLFPTYSKARTLLKVLAGKKVSDFKSMQNSVLELSGTPQEPVDWMNPDEWIDDRLSGQDAVLAKEIWNKTSKSLNPRHLRGVMFLLDGYNLIVDKKGKYELTEKGIAFLQENNTIERNIDWEEGLIQALFIVSQHEKGKRSDFVNEWIKYIKKNSNVKEDSVAKDYLSRRINNLIDRGFIHRDGVYNRITKHGVEYLQFFKDKLATPELTDELRFLKDAEKYQRSQIVLFRSKLLELNPYSFEHTIKDLLEAIGYEDVEVTSPTNDKGVDVTGVIQIGITSVKEVVQVKRTLSNVQRPILDALRGSLHRFNAFRGTIITLGDFSKGTKDAAFEIGAAPITLINGDKLIDLLIDNEIGLNKKMVEYFSIDKDYFEKSAIVDLND
jgi:restriction system protein